MPPENNRYLNPMYQTVDVQDDEEDTIEDDFHEISKKHDFNTSRGSKSRGSLVMGGGAKGYRTEDEEDKDDCRTEKGNLFKRVNSDVSSDWSDDGMNDISENIKSRRAKHDPVRNKP